MIQTGSTSNRPDPFGAAKNGVIAYGAGGDIVTVDPATGVIETLVGGADEDSVPRFSSDGTRIAFVRTIATEQTCSSSMPTEASSDS